MPKRLYLSAAVLFLTRIIFAGEVTTKASLKNVKVFLGGAEITHSVKADIERGVSDIVVGNVAENINQNSLQVGGTGSFVILSVSTRKNYMGEGEKPEEIKVLFDSLKLLNEKLDGIENKIHVYNIELDLLLANKNLGNDTRGVTVTELKNMADYFNKTSTRLLTDISDQNRIKENVNDRIEKIKKQIDEMNKKQKNPPTEIVVKISADKNTTANFDISYITFDAGWNPSYDIRVKDISSPMKLDLRANVWQNTGMNWDNVNISLSTRSARQSNNKPELHKWYLDFIKDMTRNTGQMYKAASPQMMETAAAPKEAESMADYMEVRETQLAVEYKPEINYTIPSDGKKHIVALQSYELPAEYEYYAAPKLDTDAFLVASVNEWKDYNLLPGPANVYFENSFVGEAYVNPATTKDKMTFSLGRDKNIYITRNVLKDFTEDKFFGSDVERFFGYEIVVKNNKNKEIKLTLQDQVPVSKHEDIEVELKDKGNAVPDEETGILTWNVTLQPGETISKQFTYSVRYPGDREINLY